MASDLSSSEAALPPGGHLTLVTTPASLAALEAQWRELERSSGRAHNVFQSYDWVRNWTKAYAGATGAHTLAIVAGLRQGRLVFVMPLMESAIGPMSVLRWLSEPIAQYGDVLVEASEDLNQWMTAAVTLLRRELKADTMWLRHVRADATAAPFLAANFQDAQLAQKAPWLDLTAFKDEAAYDARYDSQQRKRRKKIRKALEADLGPVEFHVVASGPATAEALNMAIAEKNKWIEERGRQNQVMACPRLIRFLEAMSATGNGPIRTITTCLTAGGRPVSWEVGLRFGTRHFAFITSHVVALTDYSPGRLHMDLSQRLALKDGCTAFDLMVPYDPHKESWCSAMTDTCDYWLSMSSRGWLFGRLYLAGLRPAMRAAYYRLPKAALKALKPIIRH